ncbi:MAG: flagellar hook-length control protein FliK [Planctomycetes bacterium]|nr:flagellar hook-length control protein FliK [Planctomycetota bacterium]
MPSPAGIALPGLVAASAVHLKSGHETANPTDADDEKKTRIPFGNSLDALLTASLAGLQNSTGQLPSTPPNLEPRGNRAGGEPALAVPGLVPLQLKARISENGGAASSIAGAAYPPSKKTASAQAPVAEVRTSSSMPGCETASSALNGLTANPTNAKLGDAVNPEDASIPQGPANSLDATNPVGAASLTRANTQAGDILPTTALEAKAVSVPVESVPRLSDKAAILVVRSNAESSGADAITKAPPPSGAPDRRGVPASRQASRVNSEIENLQGTLNAARQDDIPVPLADLELGESAVARFESSASSLQTEAKKSSAQSLTSARKENSTMPVGIDSFHKASASADGQPFQRFASPADQIRDAVVSRSEELGRTGRLEVHLRLEPPDLGTVRVHLTSTDGEVNGRIVVQASAAKAILESQMPALRERLGESGIHLSRFDVTREGMGQSGSRQDQHPPAGNARVDEGVPDVHAAPAAPATQRIYPVNHGRVDLLA